MYINAQNTIFIYAISCFHATFCLSPLFFLLTHSQDLFPHHSSLQNSSNTLLCSLSNIRRSHSSIPCNFHDLVVIPRVWHQISSTYSLEPSRFENLLKRLAKADISFFTSSKNDPSTQCEFIPLFLVFTMFWGRIQVVLCRPMCICIIMYVFHDIFCDYVL